MTPDDVKSELRAARPVADAALHAKVRAIATREPERRTNPFARLAAGRRRGALIAVPAAAVLAVATAGAIGIARSGEGDANLAARDATTSPEGTPSGDAFENSKASPPVSGQAGPPLGSSSVVVPPGSSTVGPTTDRAQRYAATLTLEVADNDELSDATQRALRITRDLGGFAANVSYATAESGTASMTLRIPTDRVQDAITKLSDLGTIVGQQVQVDDLQEGLDELDARIRALREQIARLTARLGTDSLNAETRATLVSRRSAARAELASLTQSRTETRRVASLATIQLALQTDQEGSVVPAPSGLDRALEILAWEGVALLFLAVVAGPFLALALAAWLAARTLRRRDNARLLEA